MRPYYEKWERPGQLRELQFLREFSGAVNIMEPAALHWRIQETKHMWTRESIWFRFAVS